MTEARAFWTIAPGRGEIRGETLPPAGADQVLVRTLASGVSRGTEALVFAGRVPPSQHQAMRAPLMGGEFPFPVKYGYSAVGRTADGRARLRAASAPGHFPRTRGDVHPVPDVVPTQRAVLAANMETALNVTWDAAPLAGERMLVIGAGVVGLLTASLLARIPGAQRHRGGHRSRARNPRATVRLRLRHAGPCAGRAGADRACLGQRSGTAARAGPRRLRGAHRRGKLVRRPRARGAARRGVPCAPAAPDRDPGRCRRAADARPAQPCRTAGAGARTAGRRRDTTRCWTGRRGSRTCRRRCRASSHPAACATSSPMGRSDLLPECAGRLTARSRRAVGTSCGLSHRSPPALERGQTALSSGFAPGNVAHAMARRPGCRAAPPVDDPRESRVIPSGGSYDPCVIPRKRTADPRFAGMTGHVSIGSVRLRSR